MASLPYPRRPLDNSPTEFTEFTEVSGARYSPTDFTDAHRLGGYGIPAIPTPPSANPPTEFTEFTEISGVEEPPTDFADAHRWLGCLDFCVEIVWWLRGYGKDVIPSYNCTDWGAKILRVLCNLWENISARNICEHLCHLWEDISAKGFCEFCEFCGRMQYCLVGAVETTAPPGRVRGYGRDAIPSYNCTDWGLKFCVFCAICGRISQQEISVRICAIRG